MSAFDSNDNPWIANFKGLSCHLPIGALPVPLERSFPPERNLSGQPHVLFGHLLREYAVAVVSSREQICNTKSRDRHGKNNRADRCRAYSAARHLARLRRLWIGPQSGGNLTIASAT